MEKESFKNVLILGNGFDLDLGWKTSYKDFYESKYRKKIQYPSPLVKYLEEKSEEGNIRWYDFENELGNYYDAISAKRFLDYDVYDYQGKKVIDYLKKEWKSSSPSESSPLFMKLLENYVLLQDEYGLFFLSTPDIFLPPSQRDKKALKEMIVEKILEFLSKATPMSEIDKDSVAYYLLTLFNTSSYARNTSIYSFNYTQYISDEEDSSFPIFQKALKYIHGSIKEKNIIFGTRDRQMSKEYDFLQKSLNPCYAPPLLTYDILAADNVVIFGHSMGDNDSQYFQTFFETQVSEQSQPKNIFIFTKDEDAIVDIKRNLQVMTHYKLSYLFSHNSVYFISSDTFLKDEKQKTFFEETLFSPL